MSKLKIGVVGAGLIAQLEHIPNILKLSEQYQLVGVADPSAQARAHFTAKGIATFENYQQLLEQQLDAILIASPDCYHAEIAHAALSRGVHVFSEKPLCYSVAEAKELAQARDRAGKVVQVGYMKRFDPNYEQLLSMLPADGKGLRLISVEVQDPDAWPFNQHQGPLVFASDVPQALIDESRQRRDQQVAQASGQALSGTNLRGFAGAYCSSLVHDINAVHGLLDKMNLKTGAVTGAAFFAGGDGGQGAVRLAGTEALWQMSFIAVPQVADYRERITLYFDDAVYQLDFPSPYLNHFPTRLTVSRSENNLWTSTEYRAGYEEAFVRELQSFWASVSQGAANRNSIEGAAQDMQLIAELTSHALKVS